MITLSDGAGEELHAPGPAALRRSQIPVAAGDTSPTLLAMSLVVRLPEALDRRVEAVAAERHVSPEEVALQAIEAQLPARRRLGFIGVGNSGRTDLSEHVIELRHELAEEELAGHRRSAGG